MSATETRTVLFVCRHGAAKSVLAAADFQTLAAKRGLRIGGEAAGVEPSEQVSPVVVQALAEDGVDIGRSNPRRVTESALASARRVITFNLDATELPTVVPDSERWDDVPAVSEDVLGARAAIGRHLERLVESLYREESRR
jgi:protein-tyrosine-phosphatase